MSAGILRALMQLFAIIAGGNKAAGREIVAVFLRQQLNKELVLKYLELYDQFTDALFKSKSSSKEQGEKRTSVNSVKILRICDQINEELQQKEKHYVLLRLLEFIADFKEKSKQEWEFLQIVSEAFNIDQEVFKHICELVAASDEKIPNHTSFLIASSEQKTDLTLTRRITLDGLRGHMLFLRIEEANIFFVRYFGKDEILLNSQSILPERSYVFGQGASIRGTRIQPLFYSDVLHGFLDNYGDIKIIYRAENVSYYFGGGKKQALHQLNIVEQSGSLVGIMGGSGAGKSTLLNVLNGNNTPTFGSVTINGYDIHREKEKIEGVMGYVAQDDLLMEELTVFQNLFYNAKLCFGGKGDDDLIKLVDSTLLSIGLMEVRDLKVGSILDKVISGGQRKRLNIALELIREPLVLFVDEPTSGLSSRDSENIMDLLKELTLKGKLVFVVIHQPSSDIFKMLDKLFILDQGGFPIYYGNPVESIIYFKRLVNQVNLTESECPHCGNVNPEQIFNIIEAKVVDEYGYETEHRKISPREWNNFFNVIIGNHITTRDKQLDTPKSLFVLPTRIKQLKVFLTREVLSKLSNKQYMLINFLEAPVLAFVLSLFIKFFPSGEGGSEIYTFRENLNFPQYLFISVVVALFLGLTVSAEEIIKDQKILKREKYLHISHGSYLVSKILLMFFISAIQMLTFVLVGNTILEVQGMNLAFWLVLFSTSCFANVLGLNISATFNSAKVIYILIPILIIPQLLFSGVIVRFDRLYPALSSQSSVPALGNMMASRWAYEAMAVHQYRNNDFNKDFFKIEQEKKRYQWKKDYWIPALETKIEECRKAIVSGAHSDRLAYNVELIREELTKATEVIPNLQIEALNRLNIEQLDTALLSELNVQLDILFAYFRDNYNAANAESDELTKSYNGSEEDKKLFLARKDRYHNESLEDFVTNKNDVDKILEEDGQLVQKTNLVYITPVKKYFLGAHFYAPSKYFFGKQITTLSANILVLWTMTLIMCFVLFFDGMKKALDFITRILGKITPERTKDK
jgi:ABC-type multidrug transport system ATPase subunit